VSASVEIWSCDLPSPWLDISSSSLVQTRVIPSALDHSINRSATLCGAMSLPDLDHVEIGSITMQEALCSWASDLTRTRYVSALPVMTRAEIICKCPDFKWRRSLIPTEARLRITSSHSESKLTKRVRSPRRQAASANAALKVVLAVPGEPLIRTLALR
jgi:hypothetical protein